jgi:hypothetical protein
MKFFRAGIRFTPDKTDTHLEAKPYMNFGRAKTGISGKTKDTTPRGDRIQVKLAGTTERAVAKAIKASGHQYIVKDRDGHPRGAFATLDEAEAKAGDSDTVFDRLEGRNVKRKRDRDEIPDPGVQDDVSDSWEVGA